MLDRFDARLASQQAVAFPSQRLSNPELQDILDGLIDPTTAVTASSIQPLRFVRGLIQLERALNDFLEARLSIDLPQPVPAAADDRRSARRHTLSLGLRAALQALLASSITTALQFAFDLNHAYWATLTVLVVLSGGAGQTTIRTFQRFLGTLGGVIVAILIEPIIGANTALAVALMILVLPLIMLTMENKYAIASGGLAFLVGMLVHITKHAGDATFLARAYETGIGAGIALLTSLLFFPSFSGHQAAPRLAALVARSRAALAQMDHEDRVFLTNPLLSDLQALQTEMPAIIAERRMFGRNARDYEKIVPLLSAFLIYLGQYELCRRELAGTDLPAAAKTLIDDLQASLLATTDQLEALLRDGPQATAPVRFERRLTGEDTTLLPAGVMTSQHDLAEIVVLLMTGNRLGSNLNDLMSVAQRL